MPPSNGSEKPLGIAAADLNAKPDVLTRAVERAPFGTVAGELRLILTHALQDDQSPLDGVPELGRIMDAASGSTPSAALVEHLVALKDFQDAPDDDARLQVAKRVLGSLRKLASDTIRGIRSSVRSVRPSADASEASF